MLPKVGNQPVKSLTKKQFDQFPTGWKLVQSGISWYTSEIVNNNHRDKQIKTNGVSYSSWAILCKPLLLSPRVASCVTSNQPITSILAPFLLIYYFSPAPTTAPTPTFLLPMFLLYVQVLLPFCFSSAITHLCINPVTFHATSQHPI